MKRFEDLKMQIPFLADFRKVFAKFRRIKSYIHGYPQRFIGTPALRHIGKSFSFSQIYADFPAKSRKAADTHSFIFKLAHSQIFKLKDITWPFDPFDKLRDRPSSTLGTPNPKYSKLQLSIIVILLLLTPALNAQLLIPLSNEMNRRVEYEWIQNGTSVFTVMKPYVQSNSSTKYEVRSTKYTSDTANLSTQYSVPNTDTSFNSQISTFSNYHINSSWFHRKLFHESFIEVDSGNFYLYADPVFEFGVGRDSKGRNTMVNTRGFRIGGQLGKYFAFATDFYENQAIFNTALDAQFRVTKVIPGQGRGRITGNTWDYAHASGYISFSPIRPLNLRLGQGKHFIGDGYRSLILSDAAYAYPYASATWQSKKWSYTWMVSSVQNMGLKIQLSTNKEPFKRETVSFHLLSLQLSNRIQLSLVQSQLFNIPDTFGRTKADIRFFNPLLLPLADNDNIHSIWGMNLKVSLNRHLMLYGQLVIDNLMNSIKERMGLQLGLKYFDVAGILGLYAQTEYNRIDPNMYLSSSKALQWMQFGEPLAHPLGSNIEEVMLSLSYTWHRWQINNQTNFIRNKEGLENYSQITNPSLPQFVTSQQLLWNRSELVFYINPKTLMNLAIGCMYRKETLAGNANALSQFYFTFRTSLMNTYYDR